MIRRGPTPTSVRALSTWLSSDAAARLFEAALHATQPGYRVVYGVSDNTLGGWVSLDGARQLGYNPLDDAEVFAASVIKNANYVAGAVLGALPENDPELLHLGGAFCFPQYDAQNL